MSLSFLRKDKMDALPLCNITWDIFRSKDLQNVNMFEDPVYSTYIEKETFIEIYSDILETFDGKDMTSFISNLLQ
jgi:hypothetical protein